MAQDGEIRQHPNGGTYQRQGGVWVLQGAAPSPTAPPMAPTQPMVVGTPRPKEPPPQRPIDAQMDVQQLRNAQLEEQAKLLAIEKASLPGEGKPPGVEQSKAAGFYKRALEANSIYGLQKVGPRSILGETAASIFPMATNALSDAERQMADAATRDFIAATLRYESGASLPQGELETQKRIYFPMPGDDPKTIALKEQLRANALEALKIGGGAAAEQVQSNSPLFRPGQELFAGEDKDEPPFVPGQSRVGNDGGLEIDIEGGRKPVEGEPGYEEFQRAEERQRRIEELSRREGPGDIDAISLIKHGMMLGLSDEAAGVATGITETFRGGSPIEGYQIGRDAERLRLKRMSDGMGVPGTALEIGGGLLSANPQAALAPLATRLATIRAGAGAGAYGGGLAGFGYGEGLEGSSTNALLGAGGGALIGGGISALGSRARIPSRARQEGPELLAASQRQNVPINAADLRPGARNALAYLEASPGSSGVIQRDLATAGDALEAAAGRLGNGGTALTEEAAGATIQNAGRRFIERSRETVGRLYDRANRLSGGATVQPQRAIQAIDAEIAQLSQTPNINQGEINLLTELREDLSGPLSVQAVRDLRTSLRGRINEKNLTASQAEARVTRVINAASEDMASALPPQAARAFRRADQIYRQRQDHIQNVIQRFIGKRDAPLSGEKAFQNLKTMAGPKGDSARLNRMMQGLNREERRDIGATIAEQLGRRNPDDAFSPAYFVSQTAQLSRDARISIFGREGADAIDDLSRLARAKRDTAGKLNTSRSGMVGQYGSYINSLVFGGGLGTVAGGATGGVAGAALAAGTGMGVRNLSARIMLSRPFTEWLARAPQVRTPAAMQAHIRRLGGLGRGTPIAVEMQGLQRQLQQTFSPALADEQEK